MCTKTRLLFIFIMGLSYCTSLVLVVCKKEMVAFCYGNSVCMCLYPVGIHYIDVLNAVLQVTQVTYTYSDHPLYCITRLIDKNQHLIACAVFVYTQLATSLFTATSCCMPMLVILSLEHNNYSVELFSCTLPTILLNLKRFFG